MSLLQCGNSFMNSQGFFKFSVISQVTKTPKNIPLKFLKSIKRRMEVFKDKRFE